MPPRHGSLAQEGSWTAFPYLVLEIKLQVEPPSWLLELVRTDALVLSPKFSKVGRFAWAHALSRSDAVALYRCMSSLEFT